MAMFGLFVCIRLCVHLFLCVCVCVSVQSVHVCMQLWQNKFWSAWEDEYIYMFTSHSPAISTFKWYFCPDKYWKWTRLPLCTFLRLHHFAAHRHIHIRAVSDRNSASSALKCHKFINSIFTLLRCGKWMEPIQLWASTQRCVIEISKRFPQCYSLKYEESRCRATLKE